jgi:hypothetical protein
MSTPPAHLSGRTLLPGALLAVLVTCAGLFALGVVIAVGPDGPVRLWLDGGGSATNLRPGADGAADGAFPSGPVSLLPGGSISGPTGEVRLASPGAGTDRRGAVRLRANTRVERRSARTPAATSPNRTAPAATPSPLQPASRPSTPSSSKPSPVASPAPGSTVVKSRERPTSPTTTEVPKQRVAPAAEPQSTSSPEARSAPAPAPQPVQQAAPQDTAVGVADGVLHRVPAP